MALPTISDEQRRQMIAEAAYFRAERRGFNGGDPLLDWVEAEAEIDARVQEQEYEVLLANLEERLATVGKNLRSMRKKLAGIGAGARTEWEQDMEALARLRDSLAEKLTEIRKQGRAGSQKVREQVERIWDEVCQVIDKTKRAGTTRRRAGARSKSGASLEDPRQ
jgi:hypothetical protein